jgi:myosin heavy subunit
VASRCLAKLAGARAAAGFRTWRAAVAAYTQREMAARQEALQQAQLKAHQAQLAELSAQQQAQLQAHQHQLADLASQQALQWAAREQQQALQAAQRMEAQLAQEQAQRRSAVGHLVVRGLKARSFGASHKAFQQWRARTQALVNRASPHCMFAAFVNLLSKSLFFTVVCVCMCVFFFYLFPIPDPLSLAALAVS